MRQYRYKINTIIGRKIIDYTNGVYSMVGNIEKLENLDLDKRNTDLLHPDNVELLKNNIMAVKKEIKFFKFPAILSAILLLASFFAWPYGYYVLLRIIATASAVYYGYYIYHMIKK